MTQGHLELPAHLRDAHIQGRLDGAKFSRIVRHNHHIGVMDVLCLHVLHAYDVAKRRSRILREERQKMLGLPSNVPLPGLLWKYHVICKDH